MSQDSVILFDLGRVIIDFDHLIAVRRIKNYCKLSEEEIFNLFFDSDLTDRFERGFISSKDFFQEVKNMLGAKISYNQFVPIWNEIFNPHPGMIEVLQTLKEKYRIYMVSNINELHYLYLEKQFPEYFRYFTYIFLSYELKLRKPDAQIYKYIIDYINISPDRIIYTDDRIELVQAAKQLNIDAFLFESVSSFRDELSKRNIKLDIALTQISSQAL